MGQALDNLDRCVVCVLEFLGEDLAHPGQFVLGENLQRLQGKLPNPRLFVGLEVGQ